jgi:uncharacterized membrane protein
MFQNLLTGLRPLIHPMVVHFPIALLYVSVGLDWVGFWLRHLNLTRAGFYTLVLGTAGAGVAALTGPDHATGDATVIALLASHQTFALITVALALSLMWVRFLGAEGIRGGWAGVYLACTLALLVAVSLTGYFGGELTYHHGVGVSLASAGTAPGEIAGSVGALVPVKPLVALMGLLSIAGLGLWLAAGRTLAGAYFAIWWRAVRGEYANGSSAIWTLRRDRGPLRAQRSYADAGPRAPASTPRRRSKPGREPAQSAPPARG